MSQANRANLNTPPIETNPKHADSARVVGSKGYWSVFLRSGNEEWPLILGQNMRVFRHFESVVVQLKNRGINQFQVDISQEQTADKEVLISPARPKVLQRASSAGAYDNWFRTQVNRAITETTSTSEAPLHGLEWKPLAQTDRQTILASLGEQTAEIAQDWEKELKTKLTNAKTNPSSLPAGRVVGTLELVLLPHFVLVLQRPSLNQPLTVLRLLHASKLWPEAV
jgi:plasmid stabilization system protein ParE